MFAAMIAVRRFDRAREIATAYAFEHERVPSAVVGEPDDGRPAGFDVEEDGNTPNRVHPALDGERIVAVVTPDCHFAEKALPDIASDPELGPLFRMRAYLLVPQERDLGLDDVLAWNRQHPDLPMRLVERERDWPGIDWDSIPAFFRLFDGKVIDSVRGWPPDGRSADMIRVWTEKLPSSPK